MVLLPEKNDPTIEAMLKAIANKPQHGRAYLGASLIGNKCARAIWYDFNKFPRQPFSAETLCNFEDGHRTEDLTIARLRMVEGIQIWDRDEDGNQYGFVDFDGKFRGHCDGVILGILQSPKTPHVLEIKCSAEKKFNEFENVKAKHGEKETLKNWNEGYYIQAQLYMHYLKLDRHYTVVASAGGRRYTSCRTEYSREVALQTIDRAKKIIEAKSEPPRISELPDFYVCRWCDFKDICRK